MSVMFGGDLCPQGLSIQFVEAPEDLVIGDLCASLGEIVSTPTNSKFPAALAELLPFQVPWTRMLTAQAGSWTALTNNFITGGDGSAPGPAIGIALGVRCVVASHSPRYGPGHAQTQLEVMGPEGIPPLMFIRSISASATDGRWSWYESGSPLPFEQTGRYTARLKRERFDRSLLLDYLGKLGVPVDDEDYGAATLHQRQVSWPSREITLDEQRKWFE